ncbi:MAG: BatA domain-containing protein [Pseudohongiellaceae bacterium]
MGFLAPFFLFGLLAVALPVAIHLIRREKPPRVPFASLRFLKATRRKRVLFQQIQQWLLLAMRAGIIALLVFAFARPLFFQGSIGQLMDGEPRSVVFVLDRSLIMQHGDRNEHLQQAVLERLDGLQPGDEAGLVEFAGSPLSVRALTTDRETMRGAVSDMEAPGYQAPRFGPALRAANELLREARHERREIIMLSAFQTIGMQGIDSAWQLSPGVTLQTVDMVGDPARNLAILDVRAPDQLVEGGGGHEVLARIRSNGSVHTDEARVTLLIDDEPVSRDTLSLADRSEAVARLPVEFESAGQRDGEVRVEGDDFSADNRHFFAIDVRPEIRVLLVNGSPSGNWYEDGAHWFELALSGEGVESPWSVTSVTEDEFDPGELSSHDVLVLLDAGLSTARQGAAVSRFVGNGGSLLVAPGRNTGGTELSEWLDVLPARLRQAEALGGNDYLLLADRDRRHPVLEPLDIDWSARFRGYWQSEPAAGSRVLMRFDNGDPALIEGEAGAGRVLLLTTALDTSWSNLPLQGLYLPFVHEMLDYLAQPPRMPGAYVAGDRINLSSWMEAGETLEVRHSEREMTTLSSLDPVLVASEPGILRVGRNDSQRLLAVNVGADAGNMEKVPGATLQDRLINPETAPVQSERVRSAQLMSEVEQPQRVWWWLLLLVMLLLLLETRVANRTYR